MIDIDLIRERPDVLRESGEKRGQEFRIDEAIDLDRRRRSTITEIDNLRAKRNDVSRELGQTSDKPQELIEEMRAVGSKIKILESDEKRLAENLDSILLDIPNVPSATSPVGQDESKNVLVRTIGEAPSFSFEPRSHWEIGEELGIIDFQRGVKLSQSRFYVLKGKGATLQRAVISWMLDLHVKNHNYDELYLPFMVNRETVKGSSHLPHFEENMYHDEEDDLFMVPTAEAPITGLFRG